MTVNFNIYENHAIHFEGKHLDLHNNYDFQGFVFSVEKRQLILNWKSTKADWVPRDNPLSLAITIHNVEFLKVTPRDGGMPFSEDSCLSDLTYFPSSERENDECIQAQQKPNDGDDLIFKFQNEQIIRVKGSSAEVTVQLR